MAIKPGIPIGIIDIGHQLEPAKASQPPWFPPYSSELDVAATGGATCAIGAVGAAWAACIGICIGIAAAMGGGFTKVAAGSAVQADVEGSPGTSSLTPSGAIPVKRKNSASSGVQLPS